MQGILLETARLIPKKLDRSDFGENFCKHLFSDTIRYVPNCKQILKWVQDQKAAAAGVSTPGLLQLTRCITEHSIVGVAASTAAVRRHACANSRWLISGARARQGALKQFNLAACDLTSLHRAFSTQYCHFGVFPAQETSL